MNEFDILENIFAANRLLDDNVVVPPGDDMAVVRVGSTDLLLGVDQLVDGRHVQLERTPLALVGRKAIVRSLSDVAAMAGRPVAALVAATVPPGFGDGNAAALFESMRQTAADYNCSLVGGDLAVHTSDVHPLTCSVTIVAVAGGAGPITRSGAHRGDGVYVTGCLGGSLDADGGGRHLTFEPRLDTALALADSLGDRLHAMIDISDGLGQDAGHIARWSGVRIELDSQAIPCTDGCTWRDALGDGEDYELCFTASGDVPDSAAGIAVTRIGTVCASTAENDALVTVMTPDGPMSGETMGWRHGE